MPKMKDYTVVVSVDGHKFKRATDDRSSTGAVIWIVSCGFCGKDFKAAPHRLINSSGGWKRSCGCLRAAISQGVIDKNNYRSIEKVGPNGGKIIVLEHRHIVENHIGKKLLPNQNIHHINGLRWDNRIENLEIWDTAQPSGQRPADKLHHSYEMIILYSEDKVLVEIAKKELEIANKLRAKEDNITLVQKTLWNEEEC